MTSSVDTSHLQALGSKKEYDFTGPDSQTLERFVNPAAAVFSMAGASSFVQINAPEFTSLCPLTGQPDFATIIIIYKPKNWCVESKSLKLYLGSFRMTGEFHEACVARIGTDLVTLLDPWALDVEGQFTPRGGISFWPKFMYSKPAPTPQQHLFESRSESVN